MITLSICIPSYNRFEELEETLRNILKATSNDFEVVVVDNCSPRDILQFISFSDERVRIMQRRDPVSGIKNISDSILYGNAKYSLLLLDKDRILGENLDKFIKILSSNDVCGGYCEINSRNDCYKIFTQNSVNRFGFLSKHPSGDFYQKDVLKKFMFDNAAKLDNDTFNFDIYMAFCASKGKMLYYDSNLVCSVLGKIAKSDKRSLTFSQKNNNLFYMPENRINEFKIFVTYLLSMNINKKDRNKTLKNLYKRTSEFVTFEYKDIMSNERICNHYGHEIENIDFRNMISNIQHLRRILFSLKEINIIEIIIIDMQVQFRFLVKSALKLFI